MKINNTYKKLMLGILFLSGLKPGFATIQQQHIENQTTIMSDVLFQRIVIALGTAVLFLFVLMIVQIIARRRAIATLENNVRGLEFKLNSNQQQLNTRQNSPNQVRHDETYYESLKSELDILKSTVGELSKTVSELNGNCTARVAEENKTENKSIDQVNNTQIHQHVDMPSEPITLSVPTRQEFVASCLTGGAFKDLEPVSKKDRRTPYIIVNKENEYFFRLDESNHDAIMNSLQHRDSYIDGFCEPLNNYFPEARTFTQLSELGKLQKQENRFKVIEKIKIKYI
ncbi:hypothetical protein [Sphingobacterium ginsenosidimutans]|uniref:YARHG domain-containing protein n=1 Tax=Sphingobacterium ginsenosidimutans TaxID=687845 RepID=A0ABP7ZQV9_9SPHI